MPSAVDADLDPVSGLLPPGDDVARCGADIAPTTRTDIDLARIAALHRLHRPRPVRQRPTRSHAGRGLGQVSWSTLPFVLATRG